MCLWLSIEQVNICKRKLIDVKRRRKKKKRTTTATTVMASTESYAITWHTYGNDVIRNNIIIFFSIRWKLSQHYCGKRSKFWRFFSFAMCSRSLPTIHILVLKTNFIIEFSKFSMAFRFVYLFYWPIFFFEIKREEKFKVPCTS